AGRESRLAGQRGDLLRLGDVARQRLLAREALQLAPASRDGVADLLDVVDARVVGAAEPDRLDGRIGDHGGDGLVRLRAADVEAARYGRGRAGILGVRTPDAQDLGVAH